MKKMKKNRGGVISRDVFSTFSWQLQLKHILLRAFLEGDPSEMLSRVGVLDEAVMNKLKKNIAPERHDALKYRAWQHNQAKWNSPPDPADPGKAVSGAAARTLPSTRAGGQDDVS